MPVPKKRTTSISEATKVEPSDHQMPDEQECASTYAEPGSQCHASSD